MHPLWNCLFAVALFSTLVLAQNGGTITLDVLALKMPAQLADQLQARVAMGGPEAATAVERVPALAKEKKLVELDRWHAVVDADAVSTRTISAAREMKTKDGDSIPAATTIELEPSRGNGGTVSVRLSIGSTAPTTGSHYVSWQIQSALTGRANEWISLASRFDAGETVLFLGKFSGAENPSTTGAAQQAALTYRFFQMDGTAPAGPVTGNAAREMLKNAKILEAGSFGLRENMDSIAHGTILPLDGEEDENAPHFTLRESMIFAADRKTAEAKIIVDYVPARGESRATKVAFADWMELPVGEITVIPVSAGGKSRMFLSLEPTLKTLTPPAPAPTDCLWVSPAARRLLAAAAGLPVPKPDVHKPGFEALPQVSTSLAKLGLELPPGTRLDARLPAIWLFGTNAPRAKLQEILAQHLPPAAGPPTE